MPTYGINQRPSALKNTTQTGVLTIESGLAGETEWYETEGVGEDNDQLETVTILLPL